MGIEKNLNPLVEAVKDFQADIENVNTENIGRKIRLYTFIQTSGFMRLSEFGERPMSFSPYNQKTSLKVQTGNTPITLYWKGSVEYTVQENGLDVDKIYNVGEYHDVYMISSESHATNQKDEIEWNNATYNAFTHSRNFTVQSSEWFPTQQEREDCLFVLLDTESGMGDEQILKITNINVRYNVANTKKEVCEITLTETNLDFNHSGKDLITFPQFAPMGSNYAYPLEIKDTDENIHTILDNQILNQSRGLDSLQLSFTSAVGYNSCLTVGRPFDNKKFHTPRILLINELLNPIPSDLDVHGSECVSYYVVMGAQSKNAATWDNWKDYVQNNMTNTMGHRSWMGGLDIGESKGYAKIINSNSDGSGTNDQWPFKTPNVQYNLNSLGWVFNVFDLVNNADTLTMLCDACPLIEPIYTFSGAYSIINFLNANAFIYQYMHTIPNDYNELVRFSLKDIPIFGRLMTWFLMGINPTWLLGNKNLPRNALNFIAPSESLKMGFLKLGTGGQGSTPSQYLDYKIFTDNVEDFTATGNKQMICGFRFNLTDLYLDNNKDYYSFQNTDPTRKWYVPLRNELMPQLNGIGGYWDEDNNIWKTTGIFNTKYLGQSYAVIKNNEEEYFKFPLIWSIVGIADTEYKSLVLWSDKCQAVDKNNPEGDNYDGSWEIDGINFKAIGQSEIRITGFSNSVDANDYANGQVAIREHRQLTNAKFKNDMTLWSNALQMNFLDQYNTIGKLIWPIEFIYPATQFSDVIITEFSNVNICKPWRWDNGQTINILKYEGERNNYTTQISGVYTDDLNTKVSLPIIHIHRIININNWEDAQQHYSYIKLNLISKDESSFTGEINVPINLFNTNQPIKIDLMKYAPLIFEQQFLCSDEVQQCFQTQYPPMNQEFYWNFPVKPSHKNAMGGSTFYDRWSSVESNETDEATCMSKGYILNLECTPRVNTALNQLTLENIVISATPIWYQARYRSIIHPESAESIYLYEEITKDTLTRSQGDDVVNKDITVLSAYLISNGK